MISLVALNMVACGSGSVDKEVRFELESNAVLKITQDSTSCQPGFLIEHLNTWGNEISKLNNGAVRQVENYKGSGEAFAYIVDVEDDGKGNLVLSHYSPDYQNLLFEISGQFINGKLYFQDICQQDIAYEFQ